MCGPHLINLGPLIRYIHPPSELISFLLQLASYRFFTRRYPMDLRRPSMTFRQRAPCN